jgi:hypothetical protein
MLRYNQPVVKFYSRFWPGQKTASSFLAEPLSATKEKRSPMAIFYLLAPTFPGRASRPGKTPKPGHFPWTILDYGENEEIDND